jgi:iron complex transport system substrate-binding protein
VACRPRPGEPSSPDEGEARLPQARLAALAALALVVVPAIAACSGGAVGSGTTGPAGGGGFPVEVGGTLIPAAPQRIVSASASHTEILYALGAGARVMATDQFSNYPEAAQATAKLDAFNLAVESVAAFAPDLVILSFDPGDVRAGLAALNIPTLLFAPPATLDDVYDQIAALGEATGLNGEAVALAGSMEAEVSRIVSAVSPGGDAITYYFELDPTLYTLTSGTFVGGLLDLLGLENIADPADSDGAGYPQLSAEFVIASDPDFIFLADTQCCGQSAATLAARPGWDSLAALARGRVVGLDDDIASRWGPRLVNLLEVVAAAVRGGGEPG